MNKIKVTLMSIFLVTVGMTLSGCVSFYDDNFGSKVESNKSAQVINPDAAMDKESVATLDGQKAEKLLNQYRKEKADAPTEKLLKDLGD
ncbi:MAG: hypothetical protein R3254_02555 [Thiomicrorhabdus sp.]|nr:hypothetical protein [Thiomicrorhabdus sp.]